MSRYFKYKDAEALRDEAEAMGLDLRLTDDLAPLAAPIAVGGRSGRQPDGDPADGGLRRHPRRLARRADPPPLRRFGGGGAKLIWGEAAAVVPEGRANTRQLVCDADHLDGLSRLLDTCRAAHRAAWGDDADLLVGLQLTHSGRYSVPRPWLAQHDPALDPRTVIDRRPAQAAGPETPLLSDDDLDRLQDRYVEAAGRRRAGPASTSST